MKGLLENITPSQFRLAVHEDIVHQHIQWLRSPEACEQWLIELYAIRDDNDIHQIRKEDAVKHQGSMNRPNGLSNSIEGLEKARAYEEKINLRIKEAKEIVITNRLEPFAKENSYLSGSADFSLPNFSRLKSSFLKLRGQYSGVLTAFTKAVKLLDNVYANTDPEWFTKRDVLLNQNLDDYRKAKEKMQQTILRLSEEKVQSDYLLTQLIMRWEDVTLDEEYLDEVRYFLDWNMPFGVSPKEILIARKAAKAAQENKE